MFLKNVLTNFTAIMRVRPMRNTTFQCFSAGFSLHLNRTGDYIVFQGACKANDDVALHRMSQQRRRRRRERPKTRSSPSFSVVVFSFDTTILLKKKKQFNRPFEGDAGEENQNASF